MFKKVNNGTLPTRGTKYSAFVDVYANEDITIGAGETKLVPLGIAINLDSLDDMILDDSVNSHKHLQKQLRENEFDEAKRNIDFYNNKFKSSHYLQLAFRSSNAKKGLIMPTGFGVIDLDYEGEIMLPIHNPINAICSSFDEYYGVVKLTLDDDYTVKKGDKIGQITLMEHKGYLMGIESDVERGSGGFGSTDKNDSV